MLLILATWEAEIVRIMIQGQPWQKVCKTSTGKKKKKKKSSSSWTWWYSSVIPAVEESVNFRRLMVQAGLGKK
jgi:hypothetical protein